MSRLGSKASSSRLSGISRLVYPSDVDAFLSEDWSQSTRFYGQSLGQDAGEVLSVEVFERMLGTLNRAHEGWLHFARDGLKQVPGDMVDEDGMLDLGKIRAAFANGETLYLTKAERLSPSLMHLCRAVELDLMARGVGQRKPVNAHIFLTPPRSQAFPPHQDEHASFVLQLEGTKEWTVYEPLMDWTVPHEIRRPGATDPSSIGQVKQHKYHLQSGDVLYMPEWWVHEARALSSHSLHVTLRIFPLRWVDLMTELCAAHPILAESILREGVTQPEAILESLVSLLHSPKFLQPLPSLLQEIGQRHTVPRTVLPDDGFRQVLMVDQVTLDTLLVHPAGSSCAIFEAGDNVCIRFPGGVIRGPALMRDVFEYVVRTATLRPCNFPPVVGGDYDRLEVARVMVRDGLLRIANQDYDHSKSRVGSLPEDWASGVSSGFRAEVKHD